MAEVKEVSKVEAMASRPTPNTSAPPVERKKNATGRRKLTPHPLNPNNASTAIEIQVNSGSFEIFPLSCLFEEYPKGISPDSLFD